MINNIDPNGVVRIIQEGSYFSVKNNDALILNKYLGYKLYGVSCSKTGFPVYKLNPVLKKIDKLNMNYDVINADKEIVVSKRYSDNLYEIIDPNYPLEGVESSHPEPQKQIKLKYKDKLTKYIDILLGLSNGCNALTGEVIQNFDNELRETCLEMATYFEKKLQARDKKDEDFPNAGKKWTKEEDDRLLLEFRNGKTIKEISQILKRSRGAISSRLVFLKEIA